MDARVQELFHEVADLSPEARTRYFAEHDVGEDIRREVEALIEFDSGATSFLLRDISIAANRALPQLEGAAYRCGPYRLLDLIGRGGMGAVYLAERADGEVTQQVAVKLLPPGAGDRHHERFLQERQILASLEHPNIARMLDAGHLETGQPFLVMEYVDGKPLDVFAAGLSLRQRIGLFLKVCAAVGYLHRNLVVHRDLKPSNILVTADGEPKLLDFGISKILDLTTDLTQTVARMLTLDYASPEQVMGGRVSTETDIYSLGAVLYQLLTGNPAHEFAERSAEGIAAAFTTREVTRPSYWAPELKGDLEFILLKALRKDPQERYSTAQQFAEDLQAFLDSRPVQARSGNAWYRTRKFLRRFWVPVTAATLAVASLALGLYVANREAAVARGETAAAQAVNDFLRNDLLAQASAVSQLGRSAKPDPDLRVRTALDRAATRIAGKFRGQPEVEADIRDTIAQTYMDLGLYPEARVQFGRALDLHRRVLGPENSKTLKTMGRLGRIAFLQGKYPEAEALLNQALQIQGRLLGSDHLDTLYSSNNLAMVYVGQGKYAQAEALHRQGLETRRRIMGPEHPETLSSMNNLASVYYLEGKYAQAEALHNQALEIRRRVLGPEHPDTVTSMINLVDVYKEDHKYGPAEELGAKAVEIERRVLGPEHPTTLTAMSNLAGVYYFQGKFAQSEALFEQVLEVRRRVLGPEHPNTLACLSNLAVVYLSMGKYAQAEGIAGQSLQISRRVLGPEHLNTLNAINNLADIYTAQHKYPQAEELYSQELKISRRVLGTEHPATLQFLQDFTFMYLRQGKYGLAETYGSQALAGRRHAFGSEHPDTMVSAADLALAYQSQRKFAESEALAREALDFYRKKQSEEFQQFRAESLLAAAFAGQKKYAEAEPLLLEAYQGMAARKEQTPAADWYHLDLAREWIVQLYEAWDKPMKAVSWRKK